MVAIIPMDADYVVGLHIEGEIEKEDIRRVVDEVEARLQRHDRLRLYIEVESIKFSAAGLFEDMKFGFEHWRDFERQAIVYDLKWAAKLLQLVDKLFPSIEVRHFKPAQRREARAWIHA